VRWRRSGAFVGWAVAGVDGAPWCWLALEALYAPDLSSRVLRGRAALPVAAVATDLEPGWHREPSGMFADVRGRHRDETDTTTRAITVGEPDVERPANRWGTVVIRDDEALARWDSVRSYETPPSERASEPTQSMAASRLAGPRAPAVASRAGSSPRGPIAPSSRLWSDQERSRPAPVADLHARFEPYAPRVLGPAREPASPAAQPSYAPRAAEPPVIQGAGGGVGGFAARGGGVATPATVTPVTVTPSARPGLAGGAATVGATVAR
jgi:hypothetical protein